MKKSHLFFALSISIALLYISIPQLNGTTFVKKHNTSEANDWFSRLNLFFLSNNSHQIPEHISTICITSKHNVVPNDFSKIEITENKKSKNTINYQNNNLRFSNQKDTLYIHLINNINNDFKININDNIKRIIVNNIKTKEINLNTFSPIEYIVQNNSEIDLNFNQTTDLKNIKITERSTVSIGVDSIGLMNLNVNNSMLYIKPNSKIDTLKADLIEKSNLIFLEDYTRLFRRYSNSIITSSGSAKNGGPKCTPNKLIVQGNLTYYNKSK